MSKPKPLDSPLEATIQRAVSSGRYAIAVFRIEPKKNAGTEIRLDLVRRDFPTADATAAARMLADLLKAA